VFEGDNWIAPVITGVFGIILSIVAAILARRGSKLGAQENRAPDVQEMWAQQEADRRMRQTMEDLWWKLWRAFQSYYRRVQTSVSRMDLTEAQLATFELNTKEQAAIDARPPDDK
jgi:hypothetical protein